MTSMTAVRHRLILIPGQKKAGTTSLYEALAAACPDAFEVPKESGILAFQPERLRRRLARNTSAATLIDATTTYFRDGNFSDYVLRNITAFDQVHVLLMWRPEAQRLPSHYRHACNFDGWTRDFQSFLTSSDYHDHANLTAMHGALRGAGVTDIRIVPFAHLTDAAALQALTHDLFGTTFRASTLAAAANSFGSRSVIPRPIEALVARPEFQVILRPLLPQRLRHCVKWLLSRAPGPVEMLDLDTPVVRETIAQLDAVNSALAKETT